MLFHENFYRSLDALSRGMLDELEGLGGGRPAFGPPAPSLSLYEHDDAFTVEVALPGFDPRSLDVRVEDDVLTIAGERPAPENGHRRYGLAERFFGPFARRVRLGRNVDRRGIRAEYANGVLTVTLPKAEEARAKKIPVKVK